MVLKRISVALKRQDWFTVGIEFVLIVVGVLFALYLDNLNQQRKDRILYKDYLVQMKDDLQSDVDQAERVIEISHYLDDLAEYMLAVIEGKTEHPIDEPRLIRATLAAGYANLPHTNRQTFDELINTGNLRLFTETALKRRITEHYSAQERGRQRDALIRSVQTDYRRITRNLLTHEQYRWARRNSGSSDTVESPPPDLDLPSYLQNVRTNQELIGILSAMAEIQERIRGDSERTIRYSGELIETIEERLR